MDYGKRLAKYFGEIDESCNKAKQIYKNITMSLVRNFKFVTTGFN
jgi:hypothetical protein